MTLSESTLHAPIERSNTAPHPPVDVRLSEPAETDEHIDGTDGSPFGQQCLSDPRHSCFEACHNKSTLGRRPNGGFELVVSR